MCGSAGVSASRAIVAGVEGEDGAVGLGGVYEGGAAGPGRGNAR